MASSLHDLPTDLMGAHHPLPFERFRPGMCYELRFNTQVIRRGLIMYDTTATVTFAFYPSHFSSKLVRGELPVGHSFYPAPKGEPEKTGTGRDPRWWIGGPAVYGHCGLVEIRGNPNTIREPNNTKWIALYGLSMLYMGERSIWPHKNG